MQNIVGTQVHDVILGLIDRAERVVVLVSPFLHMWPELRRALARAVARGVRLTLITRGPQGGPSADDLAIFEELEATIHEVPRLHLKAYLSEREALHTSVNLTRQSLGKSLESSLLFERESDEDGWNQVFEVWQKTLDDCERATESEPMSWDEVLADPREKADAGDPRTRAIHRYCIVCGVTASTEGDQVVCLRCRARAIAEDMSLVDIAGRHCTRCNGEGQRVTVERPLCDPCYREERAWFDRRPAWWFVSGTTGAIQVWRRLSQKREWVDGPGRRSAEALARRWDVLMPKGGWLTAVMTSSRPKGLPLWEEAMPPGGSDLGALQGLLAERAPTRNVPPCPDMPGLDLTDALHVAYTHHDAPRIPYLWSPDQPLATWQLDLPAPDKADRASSPAWILPLLLAPRCSFPADMQLEAGRAHLMLEVELSLPSAARAQWRGTMHYLLPWMLAALHTYGETEVREWFTQAASRVVERIVEALAAPGPLGPALLVRSRKGKITDLPHRLDRVTAMRIQIAEAEGWSLRGTVSTARKATIH